MKARQSHCLDVEWVTHNNPVQEPIRGQMAVKQITPTEKGVIAVWRLDIPKEAAGQVANFKLQDSKQGDTHEQPQTS
jgi:hypothetical protein